jgi:TonB-dependent receptor
LQETIAAGYLRSDVKAFENRFWLVAGVRFERTLDEGLGPLNDIRNTYVRNAAGQIVLGSNGRPTTITADAMTLAKLQYKELGAYSEKNYQSFYPSVNASYTLGRNFVVRSAFARTIGRPDLSFITPGTTISDPSAAAPTITVVNTGLQPWTADNYDLTLESYEYKGATLSLSGFRKEISKFFTAVRIPATPVLMDLYGLPDDLEVGNYEIITRANSPDQANINGFEWSWRQSLRPLTMHPSWARSLGFFVNATHLRLSGPGADNFTGYSTRVFNYGVAFTRANFALKVNATNSNGPLTAYVATSSTSPAGTYTATAPRTIVSGSLEYRVTKRLTFHLSGQNLSYSYWRSMNYSPGVPEYARPAQFRDNGVEYVVGVKGEF